MSDDRTLPACCYPSEGASPSEQDYCAYQRGGSPERAGLSWNGKPCPTWAELEERAQGGDEGAQGVIAKWAAVDQARWEREVVPGVTLRDLVGAALGGFSILGEIEADELRHQASKINDEDKRVAMFRRSKILMVRSRVAMRHALSWGKHFLTGDQVVALAELREELDHQRSFKVAPKATSVRTSVPASINDGTGLGGRKQRLLVVLPEHESPDGRHQMSQLVEDLHAGLVEVVVNVWDGRVQNIMMVDVEATDE